MKTVLITGANKGIGFETARQLAQLNYFVYLGSRDKTNGENAIKKLNASGISNVELIEMDTTDINSIKQAREKLESKIDVLDILINNAGIAGANPQNISAVGIDNLRSIFETNFFGVVQTTQAFIPLLKRAATPTIVNVSSGLASLALHGAGKANPIYDAYSASKIALNAFTVLLAKEFSNSNFKINSIAPGYTATNLNQFKGTQTAAEAAAIIVKYATSDNEKLTGKYLDKEGELAW